MKDYSMAAIQSVRDGQMAFCKFLSGNDAGSTGGHQAGILISKTARKIMFNQDLPPVGIIDRWVEIKWQDDISTQSRFIYYSSKNELRITNFGRNFPFLQPDQAGALFVFVKHEEESFSGFFLDTEDEINQFLDEFGLSPTETNRLIPKSVILPENRENLAMQGFIEGLTVDFPTSKVMSHTARMIQNMIYNHENFIQSNPDRKIIDWTNTEYKLFRAVEQARYGALIANGFENVESFIATANQVLNRRKSRAGHSLEDHLAAIFDGNEIRYQAQAVTEGNKRPDFLFPSQQAYHDLAFPENKLISLAAKTTCKDRWRQIINEADRLRGKTKFLCTLQQSISGAQMDEMLQEKIVLVVPKPYIQTYPRDRQNRIWTIKQFVDYLKEVESL